jgi:IS30 family transposase
LNNIGPLSLPISISTVYRALQDGLLPKILIPKLRRQGRKSHGKDERRGKFRATTSIEVRPEIVAKRERIGDWEGDTVCGTRGSGHLLTLVDRTTSFLVACKMKDRQADTVPTAMTDVLSKLPCHTITLDNGKEFARFAEIEEELKTRHILHIATVRGSVQSMNILTDATPVLSQEHQLDGYF